MKKLNHAFTGILPCRLSDLHKPLHLLDKHEVSKAASNSAIKLFSKQPVKNY
ncbi:hypothetical protein Tagg_1267 [Thermosphaera aggregans DSM 11486]|uniref:Uncharacterized protein n=1 Tax=Thermosphaera aggregans (strain DSM 11486 / M11TL) TaxID=633148 RepID=D5U332_THEAM|nr:hypothetical protein Tagg_1267 [Thermosphaera aggregans DSM 11486]